MTLYLLLLSEQEKVPIKPWTRASNSKRDIRNSAPLFAFLLVKTKGNVSISVPGDRRVNLETKSLNSAPWVS